MNATEDIRTVVREKYGEVAEGRPTGKACCGAGSTCCADDIVSAIGYTPEQIAAIPEGANLGLGCGNPLEYARVQPGETVLDLGSGAGIDVFLAARETGPTGHVIGVDMTASMIEKARANAKQGGFTNVEFRLGEIEHLPVADSSVDVIISNCVVNLSPDKAQVFRDAWRVLKPGARMLLSDLVLIAPLSEEMQKDVDLYCGCVGGASMREEYLALIRAAGFTNVEVVGEGGYSVGADDLPADSPELKAYQSVISIKVRALKP